MLTRATMEVRQPRVGGHYEALGVPADASPRAIEVAFAGWRRRLSEGEAEPDSFRRAEAAYHVLSTPDSRARHDRQLGLSTHPAWADAGKGGARTLCRRGIWHLSQGRAAAALQILWRAEGLSPGDPLIRSYLGVALARTRTDLHEAARHGEFAVERRPGEAAFLFNLAEVYAAAGLRARAVRARALAWRAAAARLVGRPAARL